MRANQTLDLALKSLGQTSIPVTRSWELNERHYGALQGLDKQETVDKYGKEQVNVWRRSYDIPPPECALDSPHYPGIASRNNHSISFLFNILFKIHTANDSKYAFLAKDKCPRTESLKTTLERVIPFWHASIAPRIVKGEKLIIAAHGNSVCTDLTNCSLTPALLRILLC